VRDAEFERRILEALLSRRMGVRAGTLAKLVEGKHVKSRRLPRGLVIRVGKCLSRWEEEGILLRNGRWWSINPSGLAEFIVSNSSRVSNVSEVKLVDPNPQRGSGPSCIFAHHPCLGWQGCPAFPRKAQGRGIKCPKRTTASGGLKGFKAVYWI
jgi:hypothetical protein